MNYYEILKLPKNATEAEIKSSYKTLVKQYHPDLYVGDKDFAEKKIKEINEAYDILSNPEKKAEYDDYLNPSSEPSINYTTSSNPSSTQTNSYTSNPSSENSAWSFSEFIAEKFEKLDKKLQLQIFIMVLVFVLALFLINLIQVQYYLTNPNHSSSASNQNITNDYDNTNTTNPDFTNSEYPYETIDDFFNEIFYKYNNTTSNELFDYSNIAF